MALIATIDFVALLAACYQAYKARDISDEFSESKNLSLALFTWMQVLLLGIPSLFLVNPENFAAKYFLEVGLLFVLTLSMLVVIFLPLILSFREYRQNGDGGNSGGKNGVSTGTGLAGNHAETPVYTFELPNQTKPMEPVQETERAVMDAEGGIPEKEAERHRSAE